MPSWVDAAPGSERASAYLQVHALQFEWAWQHPDTSLAIRDTYRKLSTKDRRGVQGKVPTALVFASVSWHAERYLG